MFAVPFAESPRVAAHGHTGPISMPSQRRHTTGNDGAAARAAIGRIHALMREHGITLSELGAAYAMSRIRALMKQHGITVEELRGDAPAAQQQPQREVRITHCPSVGHDPRYQVPPGALVVGAFTAEWNKLRGGGR